MFMSWGDNVDQLVRYDPSEGSAQFEARQVGERLTPASGQRSDNYREEDVSAVRRLALLEQYQSHGLVRSLEWGAVPGPEVHLNRPIFE